MSDYETHYMESERALRKAEAEVERLKAALMAAEATWRQRCEQAEAEVERLTRELAEEHEGRQATLDALGLSHGRVLAAEAEIERLRAALLKYGGHSYPCLDEAGQPCVCGWDDIRSATLAKEVLK